MKIVSTFHRPSSVVSSLKCSLTAGVEHLVVAKLDGLDVYSLQPEGLRHECRWDILGNVLTVKALPVSETGPCCSNLIVMLDHPEAELIFLEFKRSHDSRYSLVISKRVELVQRNVNQRPAEFFNDLIVHPHGRIAIASCFSGKIKVVRLNGGHYLSDMDVSIEEHTILSIEFLPSSEEYLLGFMYIDHSRAVRLDARTYTETDDFEPSTALRSTTISSKVIPYPDVSHPWLVAVSSPSNADSNDQDLSEPFVGGVLVLNGTQILLFELASESDQRVQSNKRRKLNKQVELGSPEEAEEAVQRQRKREKKKQRSRAFVEWPFSSIASCCPLEGEPLRYLLGDVSGRLAMLSLHDVPSAGLVLIPLGLTSPPTTLTYLTDQMLFVGSHAGDSQLVQIHSSPVSSLSLPTLPIPPEIASVPVARLTPASSKGKGRENPPKNCVLESQGSYLRVVDSFKNIAPIFDAVLVDTEKSGHHKIVTCSGGYSTGSINVVRKGAELQQLATIEGIENVVGMFPLRRSYDNKYDEYVLVSTFHETFAFEVENDGSWTRIEDGIGGFSNERTLCAGDVKCTVVKGRTEVEYQPRSLVVQVLDSSALLFETDMVSVTECSSFSVPGSKITAAAMNASQIYIASDTGTLVCLEANYGNKLEPKYTSAPGLLGWGQVSAISCSPPLAGADASEYVVIAYWGDNKIQVLRQKGKGFEVVHTTETLRAVVRNLALCDFGSVEEPRPYLLAGLGDGTLLTFTWSEGRLLDQQAANMGDLPVFLSPCNVQGKNALLAAGSRTAVLSWQTDRIHHSPVVLNNLSAVAPFSNQSYPGALILANESGLIIGEVKSVEQMDIQSIPFGPDVPQKIVYEPSLKAFGVAFSKTEPVRVGSEELSITSTFRILDDVNFETLGEYTCPVDEEITCITSIQDSRSAFFCAGTDKDSAGGRVLAFALRDMKPSLAACVEVPGCVYCITRINDLIAVGVDSAVIIFRIESAEDCSLVEVSRININYFVTSLAAVGNRLILGDQICSITVLELDEDLRLKTIGRDMSPLGPVAVQALSSGQDFIAANDRLNLISFTLEQTDQSSKLSRDGFFYQGDLISKIVPGSMADSNTPALQPIHMFFTASGRIGVIVDITDDPLALELTALHRNIVGALPEGHLHTQYRAPKHTARKRTVETAYGFLDGDFMEQMLTMSPAALDRVVAGSNDAERLQRPLDDFRELLKSLQALH